MGREEKQQAGSAGFVGHSPQQRDGTTDSSETRQDQHEITTPSKQPVSSALPNSAPNLGKIDPKDVVVFCDYDATISTRFVTVQNPKTGQLEKQKGLTAVQLVEHWSRLPPSYHDAALKTHNHYFAIENDASMSKEVKTPFMIEWYEKTIDATVEIAEQINFREGDLPSIVQDNLDKVQIRPGMPELIKILKEKQIPLVIISAGYGNIIEEVLSQNGIARSDYVIWSNQFEFDTAERTTNPRGGLLKAVKPPLLHMYNKQLWKSGERNPAVPEAVWAAIGQRNTAISIGDSLGDAQMGDAPQFVKRWKFGLLNYNEDELRAQYEAAFDVVFAGDGPAWPILEKIKNAVEVGHIDTTRRTPEVDVVTTATSSCTSAIGSTLSPKIIPGKGNNMLDEEENESSPSVTTDAQKLLSEEQRNAGQRGVVAAAAADV
ncbi:unnamed protein product [Amoebophrya sp. A120]|nr:unnamed protein product [Amoebophrya sp. A120]|eukprot:GSA120T00003469001.1